jgi:hypothetical protein
VSDYIIAVATDRGIFLLDYNPANPELTWTSTIGAQDGLPSDEINDFSLIDSTLWIATPAGYASFPIEMVKNRALHPSVRIAQFIAAGKDHRESTNTLINYDQQGIRISFSGICFRSLGKFSYKYTLSGLDNEWHFTTNEQVEYPYLEPGNYTFQVFAQNHQGNWSTKPATFSFTILTPYWMSTWFRIVIVATLLLIALFVFWAILSSQRRKLQMRQDLNNAEQRALIGQMNPHFIFNSLNSIQSYYMTHDLAKANDFLSEFGTLIRSTLNNSRKPFVSLSNEVSEISTYLGLESLRLDHRFDFQITVAPELESKSFQIPTMILQPFLENAIWHGVSHLSTRKGLILIRFTLESWCIRCEIEDNGIGREKSMELRQAFSKKRKSHAMNIAAERISLMNGSGTAKISLDVIDLFDADGLSSGTKIVLCFPIISNKGSNHEDN